MEFRFSKMRKAQSATEYLMTYGWAILAIAIVGALLYTQVFSTNKCAEGANGFPMTGSVTIDEYNLQQTDGVMHILVNNEVGKPIYIKEVAYIDNSGTETSIYTGAVASDTIIDGDSHTITTTTAVPGATAGNVGDCYSHKIKITYETCTINDCSATTGIDLVASGTLSGAMI